MASLQQVLDQALTLSDDDQERLMAQLLGRIVSPPEHERAWEAELRRRAETPEQEYEDWDAIRHEVFPRA